MPDIVIEQYELYVTKYVVRGAKNRGDAIVKWRNGEAELLEADDSPEYLDLADQYWRPVPADVLEELRSLDESADSDVPGLRDIYVLEPEEE